MKLTAMSRAYVRTMIEDKKNAVQAELKAQLAQLENEGKKAIHAVKALAERKVARLAKELLEDFAKAGLTWREKTPTYHGSNTLEDNFPVEVTIGTDDFEETAVDTDRRYVDHKCIESKEWVSIRMDALQKRIDKLDDACERAIQKAIFTIETSREDAASIEDILNGIVF